MRCALLLLLALPSHALADVQADLTAGNEGFWEGRFDAAATAYRKVTEAHPDSGDAWFNLGTAYARDGRLGPAIHALEQARLLEPGDPDTLHNLAQVRAQALSQALSLDAQRVVLPGDDDTGAALLDAVSPGVAAGVFALTWVGLFLALAWWRRTRSAAQRPAAGFLALVFGLLALGAGSVLLGQAWSSEDAHDGVVLEAVRVHDGPGPNYAPAMRVSAGVKVRLRGVDSGWQRVQLPDGSEGWLAQDKLAPLRRPSR